QAPQVNLAQRLPVNSPSTPNTTPTRAYSSALISSSMSFLERNLKLKYKEAINTAIMANHMGTWKNKFRIVSCRIANRGTGTSNPPIIVINRKRTQTTFNALCIFKLVSISISYSFPPKVWKQQVTQSHGEHVQGDED